MKTKIIVGLGIIIGVCLILVVVVLSQPDADTTATPITLEKGGQISVPVTATVATTPIEPTAQPTVVQTPSLNAKNGVAERLPTPTLVPSRGIIPHKIKIPAIGVDTFVERVGVTKEGTMDVPKNVFNTGWFGEGGYKPGDNGRAVIDGHLDWPGTQAIFWNLDKLKTGDKIMVSDDTGRTLVFEVTRSAVYPYNDAPLQEIFGPSTEPLLNLVTCIGHFDQKALNYDKRLVVFSKLVG